MSSVAIIITAIAVLFFSGLPSALLSRRGVAGQRASAVLMFAGSVLGLIGAAVFYKGGNISRLCVEWFLPVGRFSVKADAVSVFFLLPVFVVPMLGSIYGLKYWRQTEHSENGRRLSLFYGFLAASMAMVTIAADAVLFMIAWEVMAVSAYFAATAEDDKPEVCRAGWVYLVATHVGTLCLIAMFALMRFASGSFDIDAMQAMPNGICNAVFILALAGFGCKAGIMPVHVWLPAAHANAPSHVSAVMSGVMLKMGIYGISRITSILPLPQGWWGWTLLALGAVSGIIGIAFAISQNDIKRMLAYSSIENIGIITIGLGLAVFGRVYNEPVWTALGLGGALVHVWNHSLFKSLLFFNAGAVIHSTGTRNIDIMGGLGKQMPRTMVVFVIGAVSICALPPLNGFVGEWLIYNGLFNTLGINGNSALPTVAIAAVALAMIGALAVACFVKMLSAVFLGSAKAQPAHGGDPSASMMIPMFITAAGCVFVGMFPTCALGAAERAAHVWGDLPSDTTAIATAVPCRLITVMAFVFIAAAASILLMLRLLPRAGKTASAGTWDCGYTAANARIQYTGSSLGQMIVNLFAFALYPKNNWPAIGGLFPKTAGFSRIVADTVLERLIMPVFGVAGKYLPMLRIMQQGQTHLYVLYILVIVIILLICGTIGV